MCQGSLNGISRCFKGASRKNSRSFKEFKEIQENFKEVLWKFQGCFKEDFRGFQEYLKERELQGSFKYVSRVFQGTFKSNLKKVFWVLQRSFKGVSMLFLVGVKGV